MPRQSNGKRGTASARKPNPAKPKGIVAILDKVCAWQARSQATYLAQKAGADSAPECSIIVEQHTPGTGGIPVPDGTEAAVLEACRERLATRWLAWMRFLCERALPPVLEVQPAVCKPAVLHGQTDSPELLLAVDPGGYRQRKGLPKSGGIVFACGAGLPDGDTCKCHERTLNKSQDPMLASPAALLQQQSGNHAPVEVDFEHLAGGRFR
jgi:hypothetical protein